MFFYSSSDGASAKCKCYRMKSRPGSFLGYLRICPLALRLVAEIPFSSQTRLSAAFICHIIYDVIRSLVSDIQFSVSYICQIPSQLMFISLSPFSVSSQDSGSNSVPGICLLYTVLLNILDKTIVQ